MPLDKLSLHTIACLGIIERVCYYKPSPMQLFSGASHTGQGVTQLLIAVKYEHAVQRIVIMNMIPVCLRVTILNSVNSFLIDFFLREEFHYLSPCLK